MTNEDFIEALSSAGITLTTQQVRQFERYYELLVATNEHVNLTAITEKKDVYLKHFYDSLTVAMYEQKLKSSESTLIDIGTGAGFRHYP